MPLLTKEKAAKGVEEPLIEVLFGLDDEQIFIHDPSSTRDSHTSWMRNRRKT